MAGALPEAAYVCEECGFDLWAPVVTMTRSCLGLYNDARFPGRGLLVLRDHYEHLEALPGAILNEYMADVQRAVLGLKMATGSERVNLFVGGNTEPHIHFHLIPRYPTFEPNPGKSPWDDPRDRSVRLTDQEMDELKHRIGRSIEVIVGDNVIGRASNATGSGTTAIEPFVLRVLQARWKSRLTEQ